MIDLTSSPEAVRKPPVKRRLKSEKTIVSSYKLDSVSESDSSHVPQKCKINVVNAATGSAPTHVKSNTPQPPRRQQEGRNVDKSAEVNVKRTVQEKVPTDSSGKNCSDLNQSDSDESVFQKEAINDKKKTMKKPSRKAEKYAEMSEIGVIIESGLLSSDNGILLKEIFDEKNMKIFNVTSQSAPGLIRW